MRTCRRLSLRRGADQRCAIAVGDRVLGVAVEGADERRGASSRARPSRRRERPARGRGRRRSRRRAARGAACVIAYGVCGRFETAPLAGKPIVRPSGTSQSGSSRACGPGAAMQPRRQAVGRVDRGESTRTSWPSARNCSASASMWRVTPPGYVHEYGDTSAIRIALDRYRARCPGTATGAANPRFIGPATIALLKCPTVTSSSTPS